MIGPRYSIIPADATFDERLAAQDLRVLLLLGSHTNRGGWCSRSQVKMSRELGCSRSTIHRCLVRLVECGYIQQRALVRTDGGDRAHEYRVLLDEVRPARFINEIDDSAPAAGGELGDDPIGSPGADPLPMDGQGVPTHGQGVPVIGAPTLLTSPLERGERETRVRALPKMSDDEIVSAAYADPAFMAVIGEWPTASSDGPLSTYPAWLALADEERGEAARFAATAIAQHAANGRKGAYSLRRYLVEKRWKLLPAAMPAGAGRERAAAEAPPVSVAARSKRWFAVLWRRWKAGEKIKLQFEQGMQRDLPWGVRPAEMPGEEELGALVTIQTAEGGRATAEMAAWRDALAPFGISFAPIDVGMPFIWVPSRWPPGSDAGEADAMLEAGL